MNPHPMIHTGATGVAKQPRTRSGFTLVELLTTIGIIVLLIGLSVPAFVSMKAGMDIKNGGLMVLNNLEVARQAARTLNRQAEMRFYEGDTGYPELQIFVLNEENDQWTPWTKMVVLPDAVEITANSTYSTLFTAGTADNDNDENGREYWFFRFLADGSTDLGGGGYPTLTVVLKRHSGGTLPSNYIVIQIDPQTGNLKTFQPS